MYFIVIVIARGSYYCEIKLCFDDLRVNFQYISSSPFLNEKDFTIFQNISYIYIQLLSCSMFSLLNIYKSNIRYRLQMLYIFSTGTNIKYYLKIKYIISEGIDY